MLRTQIIIFADVVPQSEDVIFLDIFTANGFLEFPTPKIQVANVYSRSLEHPPSNSVSPASALADLDFPYLVVGHYNIHNPASDPLCVISSTEEWASAPYFDQAMNLGYTLHNTPGVYTRYPLSGGQRRTFIDLAFANSLIFPAFQSRDGTILLFTHLDHVP